jgi:hypothetical protein
MEKNPHILYILAINAGMWSFFLSCCYIPTAVLVLDTITYIQMVNLLHGYFFTPAAKIPGT